MKIYLIQLTILLALGIRDAQCFGVKGVPVISGSDGSCTGITDFFSDILSRRSLVKSIMVKSSLIVPATSMGVFSLPQDASARLESVNRPDLLPQGKGLNVIQTEKFLTTGQVRRLNDMLVSLEKDTGFRVRVLCQNYPNTPGLAIRDYWSLGKEDQLDDKYVVLVVDQFGGRGNSLNFNVGDVSTHHFNHQFGPAAQISCNSSSSF
jgi:hypothetical protein